MLKTETAITAIQKQSVADKTPLLAWDVRKKPDFISIYKNDKYHAKYTDIYDKHLDTFWTKSEISIAEDFNDWNTLDEQDKALILNVLRIFTQADASVLDGYNQMSRIFAPMSIKMMLADFQAREAIHTDAYSLFTDTMGRGSDFYCEFLEVPEMKRKFTFMQKSKVKPIKFYLDTYSSEEQARTAYIQDVIRMLATYSLFTEGIELFAMFSVLFSYRVLLGKMQNVATIVEWSIRDESIHIHGNSNLINEIISENPHVLTHELISDIYGSLEEVIEGQDHYVDFLYQNYNHIEDRISKEDLKTFNRHMGDVRLKQVNLEPVYNQKNPLKWLDEILLSPTLTNFFSSTVTEYARNVKGERSEVLAVLDRYKHLVKE